jgi:hypothetical protein
VQAKNILTNRAFCRHVTTSSGRLLGEVDVVGVSAGAMTSRGASSVCQDCSRVRRQLTCDEIVEAL